MTRVETEIISLHDRGFDKLEIVVATGHHPTVVGNVVDRLGNDGLGSWRGDARAHTRALEAALIASGGRFA